MWRERGCCIHLRRCLVDVESTFHFFFIYTTFLFDSYCLFYLLCFIVHGNTVFWWDLMVTPCKDVNRDSKAALLLIWARLFTSWLTLVISGTSFWKNSRWTCRRSLFAYNFHFLYLHNWKYEWRHWSNINLCEIIRKLLTIKLIADIFKLQTWICWKILSKYF